MTENQKFIAGIAIGAAAGAALGIFLSSDKGKELIAQIKDIASDTSEELKSKLTGWEKDMKDWVQRGKSFVSDLSDSAAETLS
ncbi:YtxH domain-containing protein [Deminuibacter soli]|uniref:YtxH domain-containing protein n=1 Tax=Deminuibacter soli TaxID=2291815 RepID=A0A3E1NF32_9BACT|nr:YtxH domain-containing protein [Deminuibacter soli]RFM26569.1 hypothetical protein DXN05_18500 [Deminuibacter soli]